MTTLTVPLDSCNVIESQPFVATTDISDTTAAGDQVHPPNTYTATPLSARPVLFQSTTLPTSNVSGATAQSPNAARRHAQASSALQTTRT